MENGKVGFVCTASDHAPRSAADGNGLTIHQGQWAYCPTSGPAGHQWSAVPGASFDDLTRAATSAARADQHQT